MSDLTNWSYKSYEITKTVKNTIPSYKIDILPERFNEVLLKKTIIKFKESKDVLKTLKLNEIGVALTINAYGN